MADANLDAVRRAFANLTGLFEDAAQVVSEGQGVESVEDGRRPFRRISMSAERIRRRLIILEGRLQ